MLRAGNYCVVEQLAITDCLEGRQFTILFRISIWWICCRFLICLICQHKPHFWFIIFSPQLSRKFLGTRWVLLVSADYWFITLNLIIVNTEPEFRVRYAMSPKSNWTRGWVFLVDIWNAQGERGISFVITKRRENKRTQCLPRNAKIWKTRWWKILSPSLQVLKIFFFEFIGKKLPLNFIKKCCFCEPRIWLFSWTDKTRSTD